mmetsp:Transcript_11114/g.26676  ORF Transcript_11114/g.26676 Transcript_11114/m.26676 type:complete len:277 (+) Transcript_11114:49-879(+)
MMMKNLMLRPLCYHRTTTLAAAVTRRCATALAAGTRPTGSSPRPTTAVVTPWSSYYSTSCVPGSPAAAHDDTLPNPPPSPPLRLNKVSVIGAGMMATAMVEPMIQNSSSNNTSSNNTSTGGLHLRPDQFTVYDVSDDAMASMQETYGVQTSQSIADCLGRDDNHDADAADDTQNNLIILAVKPQNLTPPFLQQLRDATTTTNNSNAILLSVIAGTPISVLQQSGLTKVVRSMPNTPATIGQGMTVWSCTSNLTADERALTRKVLSSFGKSVSRNDW